METPPIARTTSGMINAANYALLINAGYKNTNDMALYSSALATQLGVDILRKASQTTALAENPTFVR